MSTLPINRSNVLWQPTPAPAVEWDIKGSPSSAAFRDIYFSQADGLAESRHVFLAGNQLPDRWRCHTGEVFTVAEAGFGTGLNFLMTWQAWRQARVRPRLHYVGVEKFPLAPQQMARALKPWTDLTALSQQLLNGYPGRLPGQHRLLFDGGAVVLDLWWDDIEAVLTDLAGHRQRWVDAWYLDGFAPARNPDMWASKNFTAMAALSRPEASVATFTAAGAVKRGLQEAGFVVQKVDGFGSKRDSLRARLPRSATQQTRQADFSPVTPWDLVDSSPAVPERALVLGAGLAGCHLATALAHRGVQVTVLDQGSVAGAGSGNTQGVVYTRLSRRHSSLLDFGLQSFTHAAHRYRQLFNEARLQVGSDGELCGMFQQCSNAAEMDALAPVLEALPELAQVLDPGQASSVLGVNQAQRGYWYPGSGWLHPGKLCHTLLENPSISVIEHCGALSLEPAASGWRVTGKSGVLAEGDCAVVAAGTGCSRSLPQLGWLPLQIIRGQTSDLSTPEALQSLRAVLCHEGYIAPAQGGVHCIGATFNLTDELADLAADDHRSNLGALARAIPACAEELDAIDPQTLPGRVGFRCASPDYLPLAGPVPALDEFMQTFAPLRKNARGKLPHCGDYLPGLYLSTGHGSRGLSSTPLAAELLASRICHEPPPLARELTRALAPARFLIRDLGRNRR